MQQPFLRGDAMNFHVHRLKHYTENTGLSGVGVDGTTAEGYSEGASQNQRGR
jgi:hypothetical protein